VEGVILHQSLILTRSRFRFIIRLMTRQEKWIVLAANLCSWSINLLMLLCMREEHGAAFEYLPQRVYEQIHYLGYAHLALAVVLLINYCIGTALVTINRGWKWREMVDQVRHTHRPTTDRL
jgi:hypothetical protein